MVLNMLRSSGGKTDSKSIGLKTISSKEKDTDYSSIIDFIKRSFHQFHSNETRPFMEERLSRV
jgi:iron-sulfur cluster repair protein YtfE (RIC family)